MKCVHSTGFAGGAMREEEAPAQAWVIPGWHRTTGSRGGPTTKDFKLCSPLMKKTKKKHMGQTSTHAQKNPNRLLSVNSTLAHYLSLWRQLEVSGLGHNRGAKTERWRKQNKAAVMTCKACLIYLQYHTCHKLMTNCSQLVKTSIKKCKYQLYISGQQVIANQLSCIRMLMNCVELFSRVKHRLLTWMRCEGKVITATDSDDLSKARSP